MQPPDTPAPDAPAETTAAAVPVPAPGMGPAACAQALALHFPALFDPAQPLRPLKLRIQADILQRAPGVFTRKALGQYFSRFTTSTAYLKALAQSPHRFDLDGQPASEVNDEHRQAALVELERRRQLVLQRRAAERAAARPPRPAPGAVPAATDVAPAAAPPGGAPQSERRDRPPRQSRPHPGRPQGRHERERTAAAPRPRPDLPPRRPDATRPTSIDASPSLPDDPAQRERVQLLRLFEASPLSKTNFCALKGITEAELDRQLTQARDERAARQAGAKR